MPHMPATQALERLFDQECALYSAVELVRAQQQREKDPFHVERLEKIKGVLMALKGEIIEKEAQLSPLPTT